MQFQRQLFRGALRHAPTHVRIHRVDLKGQRDCVLSPQQQQLISAHLAVLSLQTLSAANPVSPLMRHCYSQLPIVSHHIHVVFVPTYVCTHITLAYSPVNMIIFVSLWFGRA